MIVYLIHFSTKLGHAQHYIGTTIKYKQRMHAHRMGRGASILKACNDQGIKWRVVYKVMGSRTLERRMKAQKNAARLCPVCVRKKQRKKLRRIKCDQTPTTLR